MICIELDCILEIHCEIFQNLGIVPLYNFSLRNTCHLYFFPQKSNIIKGNQYQYPYNIEAVRKNIKWGKGEGDRNFGEKNQDFFFNGEEF